LLDTAASDGRSMFNRLKRPAQRATWSRFRAQAEYLDEVDEIGDTAYWVEGVVPSKVADFAGEAAAQDIDTLSDYGDAKKLALVACLAHIARTRARDDLAEMLCKRVSSIVKKAKTELEEIRLRQRAVSERLIGTYRTVLESLDPDGEEPGEGPARAVAAVEEAGGFAAQLTDIEEVSAYHGDNYEVLVHRFFRMDRATMFDLAGKLDLVATSGDASVLTALEHACSWHAARRDHIPLPPPAGGEAAADSGIEFASGNWRRAVTDRRHPGMVVRRHFEAMVFTYLAEELRTGDIAVTGAGEYAGWRANLLPWEECEPLLEAFCAGVGLPATAAGFTERLRHAHLDA
ncbi:MAG: Tn3 family transposase, partial [Streptosporangiaceae bacterium]